jgi:hypothetical protein
MTSSAGISALTQPGITVVGGNMQDKKISKRANPISEALRIVRKAHGGSVDYHYGAINAVVGGRTDHLPMKVLAGSYVIPADIVSARGEGNTAAGFKVYDKMFNSPEMKEHISKHTSDKTVPIVAAGGEYVIHPAVVGAIAGGDVDAGHSMLDKFVLDERKKLVSTLKKLAPPKKD